MKHFTKEEIAKHNTFGDCWLIIDNCVWEVTDFMRDHPGGAALIRMYGGKDATIAFREVHSDNYLLSFLPNAFLGVVGNVDPVSCVPAGLAAAQKKAAARPKIDERSVLLLPRTIYTAEQEAYRLEFRKYLTQHVVPKYDVSL
jgi:cytochrome b involved in lipid metabolism